MKIWLLIKLFIWINATSQFNTKVIQRRVKITIIVNKVYQGSAKKKFLMCYFFCLDKNSLAGREELSLYYTVTEQTKPFFFHLYESFCVICNMNVPFLLYILIIFWIIIILLCFSDLLWPFKNDQIGSDSPPLVFFHIFHHKLALLEVKRWLNCHLE